MTVSNELIDQLLAGYKKPEDLIGENDLLKQLTKRLLERALEAALTRFTIQFEGRMPKD
jgi:putative transposase